MRTLQISTLVAALCFATAAAAQVNDSDSFFGMGAGMGTLEPNKFNGYWRAEGTVPLRDACLSGDEVSCFKLSLGDCAHENPSVAIAACSRELRWDQSRRQEVGGRRLRAAVYALRGAAYYKQGNLAEAITDYRESITRYDQYFWVHADLASALFDSGDYAGALTSIEEAILLLPDSPLLLNGRARVLATAPDDGVRNPQQAMDDVTAAIALSGDRVPLDFYDTQAAVHAANGDFDQAIEIQQRVVSQLPDGNPSAAGGYQERLDYYLLQQYLRTPPSD
jgi:tetratricopeptide (TPR) repeat protein